MNIPNPNNLPKDFDWQFYIDNHPDLQDAGINTELAAITHYLTHGVFEDRVYKFSNHNNIKTNINHSYAHLLSPNTQITLFTQWYNHEETQPYRLKCLINNLNNPYINHIHIFCENNSEQELITHIKNNIKISLSFIESNISYADWMRYADEHYPQDIKILANSDIYFDNTLQLIYKQKFSYNTLYAITRKDLAIDGSIVNSHDYYNDIAHPTQTMYSQDCWIYFMPLRIKNMQDIDYKLGYNNCDRLLKKYLEKEKFLFINLYPYVNAIHVDYRKHKAHKSYVLNDLKIEDHILPTDKTLDINILDHYDNNLECITLLATGKEFDNGDYDYFINMLLSTFNKNRSNKSISKQIDFVILTHKNPSTIIQNFKNITKLKKIFRDVKVLQTDIPDEFNFYNNVTPKSNLKYGLKSGPNYCFFQTFNQLSNYNTTLFLECDCILLDNWLERIYYYCKYSSSFWISGAVYDGDNLEPYHSIVNQHLNGGVCLYATGNNFVLKFMQMCFELLPIYVEKFNKDIPYDYCIYQIIEDYFNFDHTNRKLWQYIKRHYVANNLLINYSTDKDKNIDIELVQKNYNPAIIHKKR